MYRIKVQGFMQPHIQAFLNTHEKNQRCLVNFVMQRRAESSPLAISAYMYLCILQLQLYTVQYYTTCTQCICTMYVEPQTTFKLTSSLHGSNECR